MVAQAMFSSSRRHGVSGIPFNDFIAGLLGEFEDMIWRHVQLKMKNKDIDFSHLLKGYSGAVQSIANLTIPFLAPANASWPKLIKAQNANGCRFGHLVRPPNSERCDIYIKDVDDPDNVLFLVECKCYSKAVDMSVLNDIVNGIMKAWNWEVLVVFCPKLAYVGWNQSRVGCVKINRNGEVQNIFQPKKMRDRNHLVIVIETSYN
ncbi:Crinkler (CRN) family protein [Thraustotheca clavata]|uniref:Crinkler (CRN) family protein n=1 Tax=Thraustotheca clavata TaxID=74557 RepID=A0A1V9ZZS8_9STRA|nr:Crinkler (CRN) family protein [Thraustotheca clavata]